MESNWKEAIDKPPALFEIDAVYVLLHVPKVPYKETESANSSKTISVVYYQRMIVRPPIVAGSTVVAEQGSITFNLKLDGVPITG